MIIHNNICGLVADDLKKRGWQVKKNVEYSKGLCGEIDVLAYKDNYAIDVEVKTTLNYKNRNKAKKQLNRAYNYCPYIEGKRIFTLIATLYKGDLKYEFIPQTKD